MVNPIYIIILSLLAGFLLSIFDKGGRKLSLTVFYSVLTFNVFVIADWFYRFAILGVSTLTINTAGFSAPLSINLQLGMLESFVLLFANLAGLLSAIYLIKKFKESKISSLILYLILIMGVNGLVMTRDLFNMFVFLEILSISTFALTILTKNKKSLSAGFKYMIAGGVASTFFLLGVIFVYYFSGNLNLEFISSNDFTNYGLIGVFLLAIGIFIELKPFPANGWALDVYESVNSGIVAIIAVVNSAAIIFVLYKILPLLPTVYLSVFTGMGIVTYIFSNLVGIRQSNPKRLLGYSSVAQMGLLAASLFYITKLGVSQNISFLIVGGFFINHFIAKALLFWIAGIVKKNNIKDWSVLRNNIPLLILFGISLLALSGLPPFPGFWAKWEMVKVFVGSKYYIGLSAILVGSLLEAFYLFRWFGYTTKNKLNKETMEQVQFSQIFPIIVFVLILFFISFWIMANVYSLNYFNYLPLVAIFGMFLISFLRSKVKAIISIAAVVLYGYFLFPLGMSIQLLFGIIFIIGSGIVIISTINRKNTGKGFYGFLLMMIFGMGNLIIAESFLAFFINWEFMTIAVYLLLLRGKRAKIPAIVFITFSLAGAYFVLAGFGYMPNIANNGAIINTIGTIKIPLIAMILMIIGFLVKSASFGAHIWIPGAYAEAEDDVTPFFSSIFSKTGIFGIILLAISFIKQTPDFDLFYWLGWLGAISAIVGAFLATFQEDVKKLMAYSSMSQLGYIIVSISLLSHLGWISGLYLTLNHFMFKAMIFIAIAGVIYRTGTRQMYKMGGLIKKMPLSFITVLIGIIAVSGVPPLSGFGSKWLLYNSLIEKGWFLQAGVFFFASAVSFLYLYRMIHSIFLGQMKYEHQNIKESPIWYLIPQVIFIIGIMAISMYPNLIIQPLNTIVGNYFNSSIVIDGYNVTSSLGYWNGNMVMYVTMGVFAVPLILLLLINGRTQTVKQFNIVYAAERPESPQTTHFAHNMFSHYYKALGGLTKQRIQSFWNYVSEGTNSLAGLFRQIYSGNGQTYILHIILYIVAIYFIMGV